MACITVVALRARNARAFSPRPTRSSTQARGSSSSGVTFGEDSAARVRSRRSSTGFAGSGSTGTRARRSAGPMGLTFSHSVPTIIAGRPDRLVGSGHVYRDYSTDAERAADKAAAERDKRAYRFRRKALTDAEAARLEAESRPYALRFQVPLGRALVLHDLIKGDVESSTDEIGDFVIVRPDGTSTLQLRERRSTTSRCRSPTLSAPMSISRTHSRNSSSSRPSATSCPLCARSRSSPSRGRSRRFPSGNSRSTRSRAF